MAASVCISDTQGQMEPLTGRCRAGQEGGDGSYLLPCSPSLAQARHGHRRGRQWAGWQADRPYQTPSHFPDLPGSPGNGSTPAGSPPSRAPT